MLSFVAAVIIVVIAITIILQSKGSPSSDLSIRGVFEKMSILLHSEEVQNNHLDAALRVMLKVNERSTEVAPDYGLLPSNPIRVNGPLGEQLYIAMLRGLDGQSVIGHRLGSVDHLDVYEVATTDFSQWAVLIFDMYYLSKDLLAPQGFVINELGTRTLTSVNKFMASFPSNFYSELMTSVGEQIGFPLVNTDLKEMHTEGVKRPAEHEKLMMKIIVKKRAQGIGLDS